jgi:hypothetical protein
MKGLFLEGWHHVSKHVGHGCRNKCSSLQCSKASRMSQTYKRTNLHPPYTPTHPPTYTHTPYLQQHQVDHLRPHLHIHTHNWTHTHANGHPPTHTHTRTPSPAAAPGRCQRASAAAVRVGRVDPEQHLHRGLWPHPLPDLPHWECLLPCCR